MIKALVYLVFLFTCVVFGLSCVSLLALALHIYQDQHGATGEILATLFLSVVCGGLSYSLGCNLNEMIERD